MTATLSLKTTVDQHQGDHPTGMRITEFHIVRTRFSDYCQDVREENLNAEDLAWWETTLADIHDAQVAFASLDCDRRERANCFLIPMDALMFLV